MATFVFVHGAWHGAWCWFKVIPRLRAAGHNAIALDLPGRGIDITPVEDVTFEKQITRVSERIEKAGNQAVLVGHSRGGTTITQVAERHPDRIDCLVYLTAFLLDDDQTVAEFAQGYTESLLPPNLVVDEAAGTRKIADQAVEEALYADCSEEDVTLAQSLLRPEPIVNDRVETTDANFGSVRRVYIHCQNDRAITPAMQRDMCSQRPCNATYSLPSSHSPFLSSPHQLVDILRGIA